MDLQTRIRAPRVEMGSEKVKQEDNSGNPSSTKKVTTSTTSLLKGKKELPEAGNNLRMKYQELEQKSLRIQADTDTKWQDISRKEHEALN